MQLNPTVEAVTQFQTPKNSLGELDVQVVERVIAAASDIAVIIDSDGLVLDFAVGSEDLSVEGCDKWLGRPWVETVTVESRPKLEALLRDAATSSQARRRQVNYPSSDGADVPVLYSAVPVGREGRVIAVGRDLQSMASMQQRLVEAQQSMERDYARLRYAETRYRLLFQVASEAVLIVDASNNKIAEVNPAAARLFGKSAKRLAGQIFPECLDLADEQAVQSLLAAARASGKSDNIRVDLSNGKKRLLISASLFRQGDSSHYLIRLSALDKEGHDDSSSESNARLRDVVEALPDGFVVTDPKGNVLVANRAFVDMVQAATEEQVRGESLERWLGRPGVDMKVLLSNLRDQQALRLYATTLRGELNFTTDVEISAVSVPQGDQPCIGFAIRNVGQRLTAQQRPNRELPRSVEQLTELVGRMDLKDIVRETTDVIERMCIEAALELTGDNRVSAAEMLGVSRQSLYVKLRRFGLGDLASENGN